MVLSHTPGWRSSTEKAENGRDPSHVNRRVKAGTEAPSEFKARNAEVAREAVSVADALVMDARGKRKRSPDECCRGHCDPLLEALKPPTSSLGSR